MNGMRFKLPLLLLLTLNTAAEAAFEKSHHSLDSQERASLRYRLENLWNEVDLLIRNQNSDDLDLKRQHRELKMFSVYERIPLRRKLPELTQDLTQAARKEGFEVQTVKVLSVSPEGPPPPREVYTDEKPFRPSLDQLVEVITLRVQGKGNADRVREWVNTWKEILPRFVEFEQFERISPDGIHWTLLAKAYRFREFRFPRLKPRAPRELLPRWALQSRSEFAKNEPALWSLVRKIEGHLSRTLPAYETRGRFLLNGARMSFFLSKDVQEARN